jgi:hypothetical protein
MSSSLPRDFIFRLPLLATPEVISPEQQGYVEFSVSASSLEEAIERANESLGDCEPLDTLHLGLGTKNAQLVWPQFEPVTASHLQAEKTSPLVPQEAFRVLYENGYRCGGGILSPPDWKEWFAQAREDGEVQWTKTLSLTDDFHVQRYGCFEITARAGATRWHFHFRAYLYDSLPPDHWEKDNHGTPYSVAFADECSTRTPNDDSLADFITRYEGKFAALIFALRTADAEDGVPLSPTEIASGTIQVFGPMERLFQRQTEVPKPPSTLRLLK